MKKPTFQQRFQYWFDKFMSRGTSAMLIGLLILSGLIILLAAAPGTLASQFFWL